MKPGRKIEITNTAKELSLEAGTIVRAADRGVVIAQAILTHGMLVNEGLHAVADSIKEAGDLEGVAKEISRSIEKVGDREVAADTIARAIESRE